MAVGMAVCRLKPTKGFGFVWVRFVFSPCVGDAESDAGQRCVDAGGERVAGGRSRSRGPLKSGRIVTPSSIQALYKSGPYEIGFGRGGGYEKNF